MLARRLARKLLRPRENNLRMRYAGGAFTRKPPRAGAFGLVQPRRRVLNGQSNDPVRSANSLRLQRHCGICGS